MRFQDPHQLLLLILEWRSVVEMLLLSVALIVFLAAALYRVIKPELDVFRKPRTVGPEQGGVPGGGTSPEPTPTVTCNAGSHRLRARLSQDRPLHCRRGMRTGAASCERRGAGAAWRSRF